MKIYRNILTFTLVLFSLVLEAQSVGICVANFSYQINKKVSPLTYQFIDHSHSSNRIIEWYWDFGNGEGSRKQNPEHQYLSAGKYTVRLKIVDETGNYNFKTISLNVENSTKRNLNAYFTYLNDTTAPNYTYRFYDHSIHTNDSIVSWEWNFGDSSPISHLQNPTHQYSSIGTYSVTLTITANSGVSSSYSTNLIVSTGGINCAASFTYNTDTISGIPYRILFHNNSLNTGTNISWKWYFGDGDSSSYQDPSHAFPYAGIYTVKLMISSSSCQSEIEIPIQVGNPKPYNLWGRIYVGNLTTDKCIAYLYKDFRNGTIIPVDTVALTSINDTLGIYYFYQIPEGDYKVQVVIPSSSQYSKNYAPTYYNSSVLWMHSQVISLFQDMSLQNIQMKALQNQVGTDYIEGKVINQANGQLKNVLVVLFNDQGNISNYTFTDSLGRYRFKQIPIGQYYVYGDLAGYASYPVIANFSTNNDSLRGINFLIKGRSSVGFIDQNKKHSKLDFTAYPNPLKNNSLTVSFANVSATTLNYRIFNSLGILVQKGRLENTTSTTKISFTNISKGIYLLGIYDSKGNFMGLKKIIRY